ncbi:MAG TPA: recombinase family protein [Stellaceae bacterium]|nr:recombinase family protein [Stellaceae bacterium]
MQIEALEAAGCTCIFTEIASGSRADRPELANALSDLRPGDTPIARHLDRLGRSVAQLIELIGAFEARGVGFRSLCDPIDRTTAAGELIFSIFSVNRPRRLPHPAPGAGCAVRGAGMERA